MRTVKIGRNSDNDIVITDETLTVSGNHTTIQIYDDGRMTICDISRNGTIVNGTILSKYKEVTIQKGDDVRFAHSAKLDWNKVSFFENREVNRLENATVINNDSKIGYSIGTSLDNKIVINDPTSHVSRYHATLKLNTDGTIFIFDHSTNGTFVNGVKIKTKVDYPISTSDTISLANRCLLDWNKIPNIPISKPAPPISSPSSNSYSGSSLKKKTDYSNVIVWIIGIAILFIVLYFNFIADDSNQPQSIKTEQKEVAPQIQTTPKVIVPDISTLYERNKVAVFMVYTSNGVNNYQGSGFFISSSGVAVSNYHVFKGTYKGLASIKTVFGEYKIDTVLAISEASDYIIFKVRSLGSAFPYLQIASTLPRIGENVFAIGNPKGLEHTLSTGIISGLRDNNRLIQTTTEITHGSSGGPLFNMQGEVIGITTAGLGEANLNFAVNVVGLGLGNY